MGKETAGEVQAMLVELFNESVAGRPASSDMCDAICFEWLPAMVVWLAGPEAGVEREVAARRLLTRMGWLLQHLPTADLIHSELLDRAIREYRTDWHKVARELFVDVGMRTRQAQILDRELLEFRPMFGTSEENRAAGRKLIAPIVDVRGTPSAVHPHDRDLAGVWKSVMLDSRARRRSEDHALETLERVARLRAGDRVEMRLSGGRREVWCVLRKEDERESVLLECEETHRQGSLDIKAMATQIRQGRLSILG